MEYLPQIIFLVVLGFFGFILYRRITRIKRNILLGKSLDLSGDQGPRAQNMALVAFGQQKMFKRLVPAILHFFIYVGFVLINIEVLEIIIDGITGKHRVFTSFIPGAVYGSIISFFEFLAVAVLLACVFFLLRRNILKLPRFIKPEMKGWPSLDANLILVIEIVLMVAILSMNAADQQLQKLGDSHYPQTGSFFFSSLLIPVFQGLDAGSLVIIERVAWWFHIIGIFAFAVYVTYSKHLHIFMAFPNTFFSKLVPKGQMDNMEEITNEVKIMLGMSTGDASPPPEGMKFGAKDINDLTWKNLMDAYSCTECGRCTSECPANLTGKKLSPRKVMMDTRDRMEEVGYSLEKGGKGLEDGKSLLGDYISKEEINACTNCNACVEACPVNINPLDIILQLRRFVSMEESASPASWNAMFSNIENNFAPWKFAPTDRFNWADELKQSN